MAPILLQEEGDRVVFEVRVQPRASRTELAGAYGSALKIRLQAPPVEGRANEALVAFLAEQLDLPRSAVEIVGGWSGRTKRVAVRGLTAGDIRRALRLT